MPIQLLSPQLANQIAAGEVVERPASVVKELLENSLDAGATRIDIDIEKGGHKRIRIRDNGNGIVKDELSLALSRHATSKIVTLDDLEQILSLGFRGEALASISAVSRLTLTSRTETQTEAWQAYCEGRDMAVNIEPAAHPKGTTIDVVDLFYNTPARRKFLRTEKTEFQHIDEVVKRIALSYPNVGFTLKHNGKPVRRHVPDVSGSLTGRVTSVVGNKFVKNAIHTQVEYEGIEMEAWLGDETLLRSSSDCQYSFVNGRGMRDKLILHAIRQAYESVWGVVEQPAFVVYLTLSPRDVDVNVHPAKHEVRFQQSRLVHDFIGKVVADALQSTTAADSQAPFQHTAPTSLSSIAAEPAHDYIRPLVPSNVSERPNSGYQGGASPSRVSGSPSASYQANYNALMTPPQSPIVTNTEVEYLALGNTSRLYYADNTVFKLTATDLLGAWLSGMCEKAQHSQPLLMPVSVACSNVDSTTLAVLKNAHFDINQVAGKYRLQQVPAGTRHFPWLRLFESILGLSLSNIVDFKHGFVYEGGVDSSAIMQIWQWLDEFSASEQWEYIKGFGKVRDLKSVLALWDCIDDGE